jgi:hypothetical protein
VYQPNSKCITYIQFSSRDISTATRVYIIQCRCSDSMIFITAGCYAYLTTAAKITLRKIYKGIWEFWAIHVWKHLNNRSWPKFESATFRIFFFLWRCGPTRVMASLFIRFLDHTQWHTTVGRTSLNEWWARRRDLNLTTNNNHKRQTSMLPAGLEPTISAGERPQTYTLDRVATGIGYHQKYKLKIWLR